PTLTVTSPEDGTVVAAQPGNPGAAPIALVQFTGTATAAAGANIVSVTLTIDGDTASMVSAAPKAAGDWSSWTAAQELQGIQRHQAVITCTDSLGGVATHTIIL